VNYRKNYRLPYKHAWRFSTEVRGDSAQKCVAIQHNCVVIQHKRVTASTVSRGKLRGGQQYQQVTVLVRGDSAHQKAVESIVCQGLTFSRPSAL